MSTAADVVVAGGGHNALACAAYLAKAGLKVIVLDARPVPGGNTTTEELTLPGFWHDACASAFTIFHTSPTWRYDELELKRYGLSFRYPDPVVTMPFPDGVRLTMWRDPERTAAEIARLSRHDAAAYRELLAEYDRVKDVFTRYRYTPIGYGPSLDELLDTLPNATYWKHRVRQSSWEIIEEFFEEEHVRAFMLWMAFLTMQPVDRPFTGRLAYAVAFGRQRHSWATPVGGAKALPQALVRYIEDRGGKVLTNKRVRDLVLEGDRCVGVRTEDESTWRAEKAVVSSIHIKHLVDMAPPERWGEDFIQGVERWRAGATMFAAHYALKEPPQYIGGDTPLTALAAGIVKSPDTMLDLMNAMRRGRVPTEDPVLLVMCPTVVDPSRAPAGHHTLKVVSFLPYNLADGGPERWDDIKDEVARLHLDYLRRFAPNLKDDVVLGVHVESPLDLERRNPHNWHGSCHGGDVSPSQAGPFRPVYGWASHRLPIAGLYQTGATTHPGGSVTAGPGRNAAWVLLDDLGIPPERVLSIA